MEATIIITVKSKSGDGQVIRDVWGSLSASELIAVINRYITNGWNLIALEELDETIEEFYSKRLTDDDIDAMAADIPQ